MNLASGIIITHQADVVLRELEAKRTTELFTVIKSEDDKGKAKEFLVEHAQLAIQKAYIASEALNYIILIAPKFSDVSQNRLLKILEEPPRNKAFILITESKSALLDTIQSRMPVTVLNEAKEEEIFSLDLQNLNLAKVYAFVQEHSRISSNECNKLSLINTGILLENKIIIQISLKNLLEISCCIIFFSSTTFIPSMTRAN